MNHIGATMTLHSSPYTITELLLLLLLQRPHRASCWDCWDEFVVSLLYCHYRGAVWVNFPKYFNIHTYIHTYIHTSDGHGQYKVWAAIDDTLSSWHSVVSMLHVACSSRTCLKTAVWVTSQPGRHEFMSRLFPIPPHFSRPVKPVHTGDKVEFDTFDLVEFEFICFRSLDRPSWTCSSLATMSTATSWRIWLCCPFVRTKRHATRS